MNRFLVLLAALVAVPAASAQSTYYVAPNGSPLGSGTITSPLSSITSALTRVVPGDTIYVRGGTYTSASSIRITAGGTASAYLHIWAYPGETPVLDFTGAPKGIEVRTGYVHLKGLTVERSNDNGVFLTGATSQYNIIEGVVARYNGDTGVQVERGAAHNLLLNVDSYENYDAANHGENADGFAIKFGVGAGNVLRGCRAWGNSDDGYDLWSDDHPEQQGVLIEGNWAFDNGYNIWGDTSFQGDSNGFKLGHGMGAHTLTRNLAWGHRAHGIDVNGNESGVSIFNNTAYQNDSKNFNFDDDPNEIELGPYVLRNNISLGGSVRMDASVTVEERNSWNASVNRATAADFVSVDDIGAAGPRQADGSLPALDFLRLVASSDLIDWGVDVGLPFVGTAPDLGAYEFGVPVAASEAPGRDAALALVGANPFRSATRFAVTLGTSTVVRLTVHDALGREVAVLVDGPLPASTQTIAFDAYGLAPGVYVVRLEAGSVRSALAVTLVR